MHIVGPLCLLIAVERGDLTLSSLVVIGGVSLTVGFVIRVIVRAIVGDEE